MRNVEFLCNYTINANGSVLVSFGDTKVLCTVMVEENVPIFLRDENKGWITAEYSMLPGSTLTRKKRRTISGEIDGRTTEIQRLISRSLRASVDLYLLGERTLYIDCDVIQADGGTRTASITGAFLALKLAVEDLITKGVIDSSPIIRDIAAVSVGKVSGKIISDLNYCQDRRAEVDFNIVLDSNENLIEVQGTAENGVFTKNELNEMIDLAVSESKYIFVKMEEAFGKTCRCYT